jgi:YVTN family beta-propeller protein
MSMRATYTLALGLAAMLVVACQGDDSEPDRAAASTTVAAAPGAASTASPLTPTTPAPTPPTTAGPVATAAPPTEGLIAELDVPGGPDWLAADDQGVWVKLDNGSVALIDPATNSVVDTVEVGGDPCQGIGAGDGSIWACSGSDVARIDPAYRALLSVLPVGKAFSQGELAVVDGQVWVLKGDGSTLEGILTETQAVWSRFALPVRGTDLDAGEAGLWVVSNVDDAVVHVDLVTGRVLETIPVTAPVDVAVDSEVWVGAAGETVRIDLATGTVGLRVPVATGDAGAIALTPGEVWVRGADPMLTRLDRATGEVVDSYSAAVTSGGDVVYAFGSIWTSAYDDAKVFRFAAPA